MDTNHLEFVAKQTAVMFVDNCLKIRRIRSQYTSYFADSEQFRYAKYCGQASVVP
jgi:late competence protein required for DNA uptake (superfamily II DNA/RNA helicase)